jgi:hypothetical protein
MDGWMDGSELVTNRIEGDQQQSIALLDEYKSHVQICFFSNASHIINLPDIDMI